MNKIIMKGNKRDVDIIIRKGLAEREFWVGASLKLQS